MRHSICVSLIFFLGLFIYSNSFEASFHFDDYRNFVRNSQLHLQKLSLPALRDASRGNRPVANITFALNYSVGRLEVFGYHLVNLLIHLLVGIVLYGFLFTLLTLPSLRDRYGVHAGEIALATSLLFISHPVQTQAVTYIVQRMTSLAALFSLCALLCYLKGRGAVSRVGQFVFFSLSFFSALMAFGSKENSLILPVFFVLVEIYFVSHFDPVRIRRSLPPLLVLSGGVPAVGLALIGPDLLTQLIKASETLDLRWSLTERVLTQFRVIIHYLSLLLWPLPSRLTLDYDFSPSHSLIDPPTTLFSFLGIIGALAFALLSARRRPLPSFCFLWFIGYLIPESSGMGVELVYEHRLYLPSVGVFLLMVTGWVALFQGRQEMGKRFGAAVLTCVVLLYSVGTYQRNLIWRDEVSLWEDVVKKSPNKARAHGNLGNAYYERGEYERAKAEQLEAIRLKPDFAEAYNDLGVTYLALDLYGEAGDAFRQAIVRTPQHHPDTAQIHYNLGLVYILTGRYEEARESFEQAIRLNPRSVESHYNLGLVYALLETHEQAALHYEAAIRLNPGMAVAHNNLGASYQKLGRRELAIGAFQEALRIDPGYQRAALNLAQILREDHK